MCACCANTSPNNTRLRLLLCARQGSEGRLESIIPPEVTFHAREEETSAIIIIIVYPYYVEYDLFWGQWSPLR